MYESALKIMSHSAKVAIWFYREKGEIVFTTSTKYQVLTCSLTINSNKMVLSWTDSTEPWSLKKEHMLSELHIYLSFPSGDTLQAEP